MENFFYGTKENDKLRTLNFNNFYRNKFFFNDFMILKVNESRMYGKKQEVSNFLSKRFEKSV